MIRARPRVQTWTPFSWTPSKSALTNSFRASKPSHAALRTGSVMHSPILGAGTARLSRLPDLRSDLTAANWTSGASCGVTSRCQSARRRVRPDPDPGSGSRSRGRLRPDPAFRESSSAVATNRRNRGESESTRRSARSRAAAATAGDGERINRNRRRSLLRPRRIRASAPWRRPWPNPASRAASPPLRRRASYATGRQTGALP